MSASLVGSEMCIRDSPPCEEPWERYRCQRAGSVGVLLLGLWWGSPREIPVSYTHLTLPTICSV
eukprot:14540734-Alexandrium_andersonii.AAC.1